MAPIFFKYFIFYLSFHCLSILADELGNSSATKDSLSSDLVIHSDCCYAFLSAATTQQPCLPCTSAYSPSSETYPSTTTTTTTTTTSTTTTSTTTPSYPKTSTLKPKIVYLKRPLYKVKPTSAPHSVDQRIDNLLKKGEKLSSIVTGVASAPVVYLASKVNLLASALPGALAVKGAILGTAIATPVQAISTIVSGVNTAIIGKIVTVPIALGTQIGAGFIALGDKIEKGKVYLGQGLSYLKKGINQNLLLQPIGLLKGAAKSSVGSVLTFNGIKLKKIGKVVTSAGNLMTSKGQSLKKPKEEYLNLDNSEEAILCVEEKNNDTITETFYSFPANTDDLVTNQEKKVTSLNQDSNTLTSWSFVPLNSS